MLLIDGAKYQEWTPTSEDEFEQIFADHASEIFGEDSKYFDLKHKLSSKSGTGSIPDGYVITFGNRPQVHIVELELESHSLQHIVSQVVNIVSGIENPATQQKICNRIEDEINQDDILTIKITKSIKPVAIHRFLSDCFSDTPTINVIIDKSSPALEEALHRINYPNKIIEFQTLTREGTGLVVHAHLFDPLHEYIEHKRQVGWRGQGYALTHVEDGHEVYEKGGKFSIEKLPNRNVVAKGLQSLDEAKRFIIGEEASTILKDVIDIVIHNPSFMRFHLFTIPSETRPFFPGFKIPFELETDIGTVQTWVTSAPAGTVKGDHKAGRYIQANLANWYRLHPAIKVGDKVRIRQIVPMKKYRLEIVKP